MRYFVIINASLSPFILGMTFMYLLLGNNTAIDLNLFQIEPWVVSRILISTGIVYFIMTVAQLVALELGYYPVSEKVIQKNFESWEVKAA